MNDEATIIYDLPADEYHRATKENLYTTSHRLQIFRRCPALYKKHIDGEIVEDNTQAFTIGSATHAYILEGDKFQREYQVADGPINPKTGAPYGSTTKAYLEWLECQDRQIVSTKDFELIKNMGEAVRSHTKAAELLKSGVPEVTLRAKWNGVDFQARLDWYDQERNILVDLKTCADVDKFGYDFRDFGYAHQFGCYSRMLELCGRKKPDCWIIAVEKREPFRVAVYNIMPFTIDSANYDEFAKIGKGNEPTLAELVDCRENDTWPTRYEGFGTL